MQFWVEWLHCVCVCVCVCVWCVVCGVCVRACVCRLLKWDRERPTSAIIHQNGISSCDKPGLLIMFVRLRIYFLESTAWRTIFTPYLPPLSSVITYTAFLYRLFSAPSTTGYLLLKLNPFKSFYPYIPSTSSLWRATTRSTAETLTMMQLSKQSFYLSLFIQFHSSILLWHNYLYIHYYWNISIVSLCQKQ
jgi:hypothetical protein